MEEFVTLAQIDQAVEAIRTRTERKPRVGMILGSGLGDLANLVENPDIIPYKDIPNWPVSTVEGHVGQLVIGELEGQAVMVLQGRAHYYEGYTMGQTTFPVRVMQRMGVEMLFVTNAAGAINPEFEPGDIMLITDNITLLPMAGPNPLRGPNLDEFGQRFPDMSRSYDRDLAQLFRDIAKEKNTAYREGVYICLAGPSFETPADLRFLHTIGCDAVGMSTVPEVIVAHHGGTRVLGVSGISNKANLDGSTVTTHEEVLQAGQEIVPKLKTIFLEILRRI
ncbi:MAG: purine-nucleoside phosphorylase [Anaerolineaceae bacterium]|jgi:purine-nucleoside phosphorylase|nr:purine-nucleoside phosphorylase [Anaerolineaceae bacterium]